MSNLANTAADHNVATATPEALHQHFLAILPRIETHARIFFRHLRCPGRKDDAIQETIAIAWKWFVRAVKQGKNVDDFVMALATYAVRHVHNGRPLCGQLKAKDVLSTRAQRLKSFTVQSLPNYDTGTEDNAVIDALRDNTKTSPDEQAAFRLDFRAWLAALGERNRRIALDLALGERTGAVADKFGTSQARISQLRRDFKSDWDCFVAEPTDLTTH
jgi:hypothetical protein